MKARFAFLLTLPLSFGVHAVNLATNPEFDSGMTGWTAIDGETTFTIDNTDGQPSPSASIVTGTNSPAAIVQCVDISGEAASEDYLMSVDFKMVNYDSTGNTVGATFTWNDASDCSGSDISTVNRVGGGGSGHDQGVWVTVSSINNTAPSSALGVRIEAGEMFGATDGRETLIDNLILGPGNTPVELQEFSVE